MKIKTQAIKMTTLTMGNHFMLYGTMYKFIRVVRGIVQCYAKYDGHLVHFPSAMIKKDALKVSEA